MQFERAYRAIVTGLWWMVLALCSPVQAAPTHIAGALVAEGPAAPGSTVTLAVTMKPETGWHGYWENPGDAGEGMRFAWSLPAGWKAGTPRYPVPDILLVSGLMNHVYEHDYALLIPLVVPANAVPGSRLPIRVKAEWLACTDKICVPESGELATTIVIGSGAGDARFDGWRAALPAPLGSKASFAIAGNTVRLGIPLPAAVTLEKPHLFVASERVVNYAAPQKFVRLGDMLVVELPRAQFEPLSPDTLRAVLRFNAAGDGVEVTADPGAVPTGGTPLADDSAPPLPALPWLLLAALAGGLLLNVMPCVFPILSLKALSLARAGESEAQARAEGLAYSAGVILACLALGAVLLALRAGGEQVGWAFQLQEPLVVAGLLLLAVAITANLMGVYEFAVPGIAGDGSPQGAFATGLLAAFVATPCTGPFMAAAMGAALLLPLAPALLLFAALGLGLALPFLALAWIPALRRRLPKPGAWMVSFRRWMALPMGLTALALAWLAWRVGGGWFLVTLCFIAFAVFTSLFKIGHNQRFGRPQSIWSWTSAAAATILFALLLPGTINPPTQSTESLLNAKPFSEAALTGARATNKPVFLYFTADWCLTCKVNERVAIEREATRDAFAKAGVTVLRGDWTRRDPAITRFLSAQGVAGVPLYLWYPAGGGAPMQLDQLLGPEELVELAKATRTN